MTCTCIDSPRILAADCPIHSVSSQPISRVRRERENDEFAGFCRRILRAYTKRIGAGRLEDLADLRNLQAELRNLEDQAVAGLRHGDNPASWAEIGGALGITRQSAQQRFGHLGGARKVGGQPGTLR